MAKGQKRSSREQKKPKATKKPVSAATTSQYQLPVRPGSSKGSGK